MTTLLSHVTFSLLSLLNDSSFFFLFFFDGYRYNFEAIPSIVSEFLKGLCQTFPVEL